MNLKELETSHQEWLIEEFVEVVNQLLPQYLPDSKGNNKVKEEINPRLVRHYTTLKLMDEPIRKNRYAYYNYRHLLQLLLVRRLLSDGIGAMAINDLLTSKTNEELKNLLLGGISINIQTTHPNLVENTNNYFAGNTSNSALEYLANLKKVKENKSSLNHQNQNRDNLNSPIDIDYKLSNQQDLRENQSSNFVISKWNHLQVLDGLELHIRDDFIYPNSVKEQESLNRYLIEKLTEFLGSKKP
ncbi:MAG: MerR family transcriptional regulator [Cyanobacteria bacterium]|nr:MerR family transcriptional regulator [Cyanobacteria bacterium CG_2015-16_32_12]NCO78363.1 MerR family transcriptional regulator [Cyanobacteria bacterium CG_2015-22_32_23]NCQ05685.1 MerR family transcriptional regulator [Cyanobacteria bacterium CG_2015-09_32_10]NCQ41221.1 MerR family transcriptional regulator [Cyanobacteria bacterium CG_2015-04_32_10]NCS84121.1 MerR family transcriptional regulator [Cyanobacteria bacterium CG_2015-02_32_10]